VWSPDRNYIAFSRNPQHLSLTDLTVKREVKYGRQKEVCIIKADGTEEPRFLARGGSPCWSSDSKRVFYHSPVDSRVYSISIEGSAKPIPIVLCPRQFFVVSPADKYVAYAMGNELRIVEISSKSVVASWAGPMGTAFTEWSPNGRKLSVGGDHWTRVGLWIYDIEAKKASKVLSGPIIRSCWSPDETRLAFALGPPFFEIWMADTASLGPGRTLEEHYQEMDDYCGSSPEGQ